MKFIKYTVTFVTGIVEVIYALNKVEAKILAQAQQIRLGNSYTVKSIKEDRDF